MASRPAPILPALMAAGGTAAGDANGRRTSSAPSGLRPTIMGNTAEIWAAIGWPEPAPLKVTSPVFRARVMYGYCASGRRTRPVSASSLSATMYTLSASETRASTVTDAAPSAWAMCSAAAWRGRAPLPPPSLPPARSQRSASAEAAAITARTGTFAAAASRRQSSNSGWAPIT